MAGLDDLFDAWDKETGGGRDADEARRICDQYIAEHKRDFADLEAKLAELDGQDVQDVIIPTFVKMVEYRRNAARLFRENGMESEANACDDDKLRIDVWIMHKFEPQRIGGTGHAKVRFS